MMTFKFILTRITKCIVINVEKKYIPRVLRDFTTII